MKRLLFIIMSISISFSSKAQLKEASIYGSLSGFRNTGFENNLFASAQAGITFWSDHILAPEVGLGYAGSRLRTQARVFQENDLEIERHIRTQSRALLLSLGLNIRLTKRENYWITAFSKVHYLPNISFTSRFFEGTDINNISLIETLEATGESLFFNTGIGIEGYLNEKETWSASLSLVYTTNNVFDNFNTQQFSDSSLGIDFPSRGGIGLRFLVRFHL